MSWGRGYATEGAKAALEFAFNKFNINEIVSFMACVNHRSIAVIENIGMKRDEKYDFNLPKLPLDHPLSLHVVYRINR